MRINKKEACSECRRITPTNQNKKNPLHRRQAYTLYRSGKTVATTLKRRLSAVKLQVLCKHKENTS